MVSYPGYDGLIKEVYAHRQEHVFQYWDDLNDRERLLLLEDLSEVDFHSIKKLFSTKESAPDLNFSPAPCIALPESEEEKKHYALAREAGETCVREGKVAAFVVAGGQGSRLGYEGPKGKFRVGPVSDKSLFQIHAEKILKYSRKYDTVIPFLIMTSRANHEETERFFRDNAYFGLRPDAVVIFTQNMVPSLDLEGRLILESRNGIFKNPDGHGGSLTALHTSGALARMKKSGIEIISYFQVDNPLVRIIDPVFIGFHVLRNAEVSSKAVKKAFPEEKVGVFVRFPDTTIGIMEYSDFPKEKLYDTDAAGMLRFSSSNPAIHLFNREFIERIAAGTGATLPFHVAKKTIRALQGGAVKEIGGLKFEKFIFDALSLTGRNIVFEIAREEEFAPIKNSSGVDSLDSARKLMQDLHRKWLAQRGVRVPAKTEIIEISPLLAVEPDDISADLIVPDEERVYLS